LSAKNSKKKFLLFTCLASFERMIWFLTLDVWRNFFRAELKKNWWKSFILLVDMWRLKLCKLNLSQFLIKPICKECCWRSPQIRSLSKSHPIKTCSQLQKIFNEHCKIAEGLNKCSKTNTIFYISKWGLFKNC
jgi:hypothetical protein